MRCFLLIVSFALIFAAVNCQEAKKEEDASKERTFGPLLNIIGGALGHNQNYPGYFPGGQGGGYYPHHGGHFPHHGYSGYPGYPGYPMGGYPGYQMGGHPGYQMGGHPGYQMGGYPQVGYPGYGMYRSGDKPTEVEEKTAENKATEN